MSTASSRALSSHSRLRLLFVSYVVLLILHLKTIPVPVESNHPNLRALSIRKSCYHLGLVDSHRKRVLRVTGGEIRSRSVFLCGLYQTDKRSSATRRGFHLYPPIHPIFIVPLCSALPVAHGYGTPAFHMVAPYLAFLPTSGCHTFRLCANVLFGVSDKD